MVPQAHRTIVVDALANEQFSNTMHLFIKVLALQLASYLEVGNDGDWDIDLNAKWH